MLLLEASTVRDFHDAVSDVAAAIMAAGGWVISHQFFSKALASIAFEIPAAALPGFYRALDDAGIRLHQPGSAGAGTVGDVSAQIALSFVQDQSDFRREVPAFG